jgi:hypothetical protein
MNVIDQGKNIQNISNMIGSGLPPILIMQEIRKKPLPILHGEDLPFYEDATLIGLHMNSRKFHLSEARVMNFGKDQHSVHCPVTMAPAALLDRLYTDHEIMGIYGVEEFYRPSVRTAPDGRFVYESLYLGLSGSGSDKESAMDMFEESVKEVLNKYPWQMYVTCKKKDDDNCIESPVPFRIDWESLSNPGDSLALNYPINVVFEVDFDQSYKITPTEEILEDMKNTDWWEIPSSDIVIQPGPLVKALGYLFHEYKIS